MENLKGSIIAFLISYTSSCEIAEMNSSLPSNLRWGPPLNKVKGKKSTSEIRNNTKNQSSVDSFFPIQATFEIGYTKRYFDLILSSCETAVVRHSQSGTIQVLSHIPVARIKRPNFETVFFQHCFIF